MRNQRFILEEIVNASYELFSGYEINSPLDICTACCMDFEVEEKLRTLPLRDINRDQLMEYNDGASSGETPINEVKHFLPRYLDLISKFEFPSHSAELSMKRISPFNSEKWSANEQELLQKFSHHFFQKSLNTYPLPEYEKIESVLIMFQLGGFDIPDLLKLWEHEDSKESVLHFGDLLACGFEDAGSTKMSNGFGDALLTKTIDDWISSEEVKNRFLSMIKGQLAKKKDLTDEEFMILSSRHLILSLRK